MPHDRAIGSVDATTQSASARAVPALIFLLTATDFMQSGMTAFGAGPISGELSLTPEEFSLVAAIYAAVAILTISQQRWLIERFGPRRCVQASAILFIVGAAVCALSGEFIGFLSGRVLMAAGGGGMFTSARMIIHHCLAGPRRFVGIKCLAGGLSVSLGAAPWLTSIAVAHESWATIYWLSSGMGIAVLILAGVALPGAPLLVRAEVPRLSVWRQLLLLAGSLGLLVGMQRLYYDFYGERAAMLLVIAASIAIIALYLNSEYRSRRPLLSLRYILGKRYLTGLAIFMFAYAVLGANNSLIPQMLQRTLGYGWGTVGHIQALGFSGAVLVCWILMRRLPGSPAPRKYLIIGFCALALHGVLLSRLNLDASVWLNVLPALALNSVFLLTVMPVTAMQTFQETEHNERLFANAQQLKNMMAQAGIALGIMLATLGQQRSVALHYSVLTGRVAAGDPAFQNQLINIQTSLAPGTDPSQGPQMALALIARQVEQQASLLSNIDYFHCIAALALAGCLAICLQRIFR
ncbi:MFS transporter [Stenotrophomonas indicatrix]|uniref:MFS transporter n=1 Tax=Stenotrophomonas indicatrix TaxID=2045451 RepID=UPI00215A41D8|nr:MFS transporter [Stenotrophomonas indicatrix]MCR8713102.1 MFS transporter [Stenotrophomonas indicatrix]